MSLAVVADPDLRERLRCVHIIARQSTVSALGAATWDELEQSFEHSDVGLIVYAPSLPGAPDNAISRLLAHTTRLVLAVTEGEGKGEGEESLAPACVTRAPRPVPEETLVLLARASGRPSTAVRAHFNPVDFIQMICMSGASQVVVLSHAGADTGVIELRNGEVWTAFDGLGIGDDAFARLIRPEMLARISPSNGSTKERTIWKGLHELVLDSLRRIDEGQVPVPPPLSATQLEAATASAAQLAARVLALTAEARRLLMGRNYNEAVRALAELSELDPRSHLVRANLEQLRRLGYPQ